MVELRKRGRLLMRAGHEGHRFPLGREWESNGKYNFLSEQPIEIGKYTFLEEEVESDFLSEGADDFLTTVIYPNEFKGMLSDDDDAPCQLPDDDEYLPLDVIFKR